MSETIHSKIAGVSRGNRQKLIEENLSNGDPLFLCREFENEVDANAILIQDYEDNKIGYINSDLAAKLAPILDQGRDIDCRIAEITGHDKGTLGVNITLTILTAEETKARYARTPTRNGRPAPVPQPPAKSNKPVKQKPVVVVHKSDKNFWVLVVYFALLGIIGGHRWYVGRGSWLYSLTIGYFLIGYCIDFLQIVTGTFKDNHGYMIKP